MLDSIIGKFMPTRAHDLPPPPAVRKRRLPTEARRIVAEWRAQLSDTTRWGFGWAVQSRIETALLWCADVERPRAYDAALAGAEAVELFGVAADGRLAGLAFAHPASNVVIEDDGSAFGPEVWTGSHASSKAKRAELEWPSPRELVAIWHVPADHALRAGCVPIALPVPPSTPGVDSVGLVKVEQRTLEDVAYELGSWRQGMADAERAARRQGAPQHVLFDLQFSAALLKTPDRPGFALCRAGYDARDVLGIDAAGQVAGAIYKIRGPWLLVGGEVIVDAGSQKLRFAMQSGADLGWRVPWDVWR